MRINWRSRTNWTALVGVIGAWAAVALGVEGFDAKEALGVTVAAAAVIFQREATEKAIQAATAGKVGA